MVPALSPEQLRTFAADGCVLLPDVVPAPLVSAARKGIAARIAQNPPPREHRGPHFYFLGEIPDVLLAPLYDSPAIALALALIAPGTIDRPDHVQISLNFPPWPHRPGGPHVDGLTPPEADGRPLDIHDARRDLSHGPVKSGCGKLMGLAGVARPRRSIPQRTRTRYTRRMRALPAHRAR